MRARRSASGGVPSTPTRGIVGGQPAAVERAAEAVEHPAEQLVADLDRERTAGGDRGVAGADAGHRAERQAGGEVALRPVLHRDDLGGDDGVGRVDVDQFADAR